MLRSQYLVTRAFPGIGLDPSARRLRRGPAALNPRRRGLAPGIESLEVRALLSGQTVQVIRDVNAIDVYPSSLSPAGSNLYYLVEDGTDTGVALMVTNAGGTQILQDFGALTSTASTPTDLTPVGNDLYFLENGGASGSATDSLWMTDGTSSGPAQVAIPSSTINSIQSLMSLGNTLLFQTRSSATSGADDQLWAIAQPGATPTMIRDFGPSSVSQIASISGTSYLSVDGNLWSTGGTASSTVRLTDPSGNAIAAPSSLFAFAGRLFAFSSSNGQTTIETLGNSGLSPVATVAASTSSPVVIGSELYFTASGSQLWASDGSPKGTRLVEDFSGLSADATLSNLTVADGRLFFTVNGPDGWNQLWTSGGTSQGTVLVKDLGTNAGAYTGARGAYGYGYGNGYGGLGLLAPVGDNLFFMAYDSTNGAELWSDDVATGTTQLVKDIDPGAASSDPHDFVAFGNQLYFAAHDGTTPQQNELWTSDGSGTGTKLVQSFSPGITQGAATAFSGSSSNGVFIALGSEILLPLDDGIHGTALWATDGTSAGTTLLAPVDPLGFVGLDGDAYFLAENSASELGLWATDGTSAGTKEFKDLSALGASSYSYGSSQIATAGGKIFFVTNDGRGGDDLWASDGTAGGTVVVNDFAKPSAGSNTSVSVTDLTSLGSKLVFVADDGIHGPQLWVSDGSQAGTQMLTTVNDTATSGSYVNGAAPTSLAVVGGQLDFIANGPITSPNATVTQGLWVSDGTPSGTNEFATIPTITVAGQSTPAVGKPSDLIAVGGTLYLSVDYDYENGHQDVKEAQLWSSGGATGTTAQVPPPAGGSFASITDLEALGGKMLFDAVGGSGSLELWSSNGTSAGTTLLKEINPTSQGYSYYSSYSGSASLVNAGVLYFAANDGTHGQELWQSDGTSAGTFMVNDINPGPASSNPTPLAFLNGRLVLVANDGTHGAGLMELTSTAEEAPPVLATLPSPYITAGSTYQLDLGAYASDPNSPRLPLTFTLTGTVPAGATLDATTGVFTWATPSSQQPGPVTFTVNIADNSSPALTASQTFTVNVEALAPPVLSTISDAAVTVGETVSLDLSQYATDPNSPPFSLTYSLTGTVPSGASIDPSTGVLTWATSSGQPTGPQSFSVMVSQDTASPLTASETFAVEVNPVQSPTLEAIPSKGVIIGQTLTLDISQYTFDLNSPPFPLSYSLIGTVPTGASIGPNTGVFSWTPGSGQSTGDISIEVQVSDNQAGTKPATGTLLVEVGAVGSILAPIISPISTSYVTAGQTVTDYLSSDASDPNTPALPLTYSLTGTVPTGASINPTTGEFAWTTPSNQPAGPVSFTLEVSDNSSPPMTASAAFTVQVSSSTTTRAPVIRALPSPEVDLGSKLVFDIGNYASDPNTPPLPLTYSLGSGSPSGASIDPTTGILKWTPPSGQTTGFVPFSVTVSDNSTPPLTATATFSVSVLSAGTVFGPEFAPMPSASATIGQEFQFDLSQYGVDFNNPTPTLTYSLGANPPTGATLNSQTGLLTWNVPASQPTGYVLIAIDLSDSLSSDTASADLFVTVNPIRPPAIQSIPVQNATIGVPFQLDLSKYASDPNSQPLPLTYSLTGKVPTGASIDPSTGLFTWTPASDQSTGPETFTVMVADNQSPPDTTSATFIVDVSNPILPPVISSIPTQSATIGTAFQFSLSAYVTDALPLTYSLTGTVPAGASISSSGLFTWTPASTQPVGPASFTLMVADNQSPPNTTTATFTVNVSPIPVLAPVIGTIPAGTATIGQPYEVDLSQYASDPNTPALTLGYSLGTGAPSGASIDTGTGLFTWTPPPNQPTGPTPFTLIVSDSSSPPLTALAGFDLVVSTAKIQPPLLQPIPGQNARIGRAFSLNVSQYASDPNTPPLSLTYSLGSNAPSGATIDPISGLLAWTPPSSQPTGPATFTVIISDSGSPPLTASESLTVDVSPAPPVLEPIPDQGVKIGSTLTLGISQYASDPNSPALTLTYILLGTVPSGASIDPHTGVFTWTPAFIQATGDIPIEVQVADTSSPPLTATQIFTVQVVAAGANLPPILNPIPAQSVAVAQTLKVGISQYASDPNSPPLTLTYSLSGTLPPGAGIDPTTGEFTWTTPSNQATGPVSFTVEVSDNSSPPLRASGSFTVNVNPAPVVNLILEAIPDQDVNVGQSLRLDVSQFASESNATNPGLTYSLVSGAPSGASINPATGVFTWSLGANQQIGTYPVTLQVSDSSSPPRTVTETFNIHAVDPGPAPTVSATVTTKKGFTITLTFSEPVNPSTAANPNNYLLTEPAKKPKSKKKPTPPPIRIRLSLTYNQATNQVILKGPKKVKTSPALSLTVIGTGPNGIAKLDGLGLAGSGGRPGTNLVASVTGKSVTPTFAVLGSTIIARAFARSADGHTGMSGTARPMIVRHALSSPHPVKVATLRPAGPMALARPSSIRSLLGS